MQHHTIRPVKTKAFSMPNFNFAHYSRSASSVIQTVCTAGNILCKNEPIPDLARSMPASGAAEERTHRGIHVPYVFRVRTNSGLFMHTRNSPQKREPSEFQARPNAGIKLYFSVGNIKYKTPVCGCVCTFPWGKGEWANFVYRGPPYAL